MYKLVISESFSDDLVKEFSKSTYLKYTHVKYRLSRLSVIKCGNEKLIIRVKQRLLV